MDLDRSHSSIQVIEHCCLKAPVGAPGCLLTLSAISFLVVLRTGVRAVALARALRLALDESAARE